MQKRKLGPIEVSALGYGCMGLEGTYGNRVPRDWAADWTYLLTPFAFFDLRAGLACAEEASRRSLRDTADQRPDAEQQRRGPRESVGFRANR